MIMIRSIILLIAVVISSSCSQPLLWPLPKSIDYNPNSTTVISPCEVKYSFDASPLKTYIADIVRLYVETIFACGTKQDGNVTLNIVVRSPTLTLPIETNQEAYSLIIRQNGRWELTADYYPGFLRGFETFSQLFSKKQDGYIIKGIPIVIDDRPEFKWRGLMIDSSRHFLYIPLIKKTIDGLLFNKMNVLHWHIIDQDSFPLQVPSVPELNEYGQVGGSYSISQVKEVIEYARVRGVRVVVEIDTPAHTHSWGRSAKYYENVVRCNNVYTGQFDPTLESTYHLVGELMKLVNDTFDDPYVHFGGDEVLALCWDLKPSIKQWMLENGVSSYKDLEIGYRRRQKQLWRKITPNKKAIYWANQLLSLPLEQDDVLHWWGESIDVLRLAGKPNEVILSPYDLAYIDKGIGNRNGISYGNYIKWREMYKLQPRVQGVRIIGGETCMWSELSNIHTHEQKIWIRTSVLGERLWNDGVDIGRELLGIAERLQAHAERMRERGFKVSPVTVGVCEDDMSVCF